VATVNLLARLYPTCYNEHPAKDFYPLMPRE
jgi:hypothetical protein